MDRRQVENVEAHAGDVRQPRLAIAERAVLARRNAARAREHFVPCAPRRPPASTSTTKVFPARLHGGDPRRAMSAVSVR